MSEETQQTIAFSLTVVMACLAIVFLSLIVIDRAFQVYESVQLSLVHPCSPRG